MEQAEIRSIGKRLLYALGSMQILIIVLILAILLFVSFGSGPSWQRGITGIILTLVWLLLTWFSLGAARPVWSSWIGIMAGMTAWMVVGEISHQFGFVVIEAETGMVLLLFTTLTAVMLWVRISLPWGFKVGITSFLLNWWGHAVLLPQLYLADTLDSPVFLLTYQLTGLVCLVGFVALIVRVVLKPASKDRLVYYGLWLYALLVTGMEGVTRLTEQTFGH